MSATSLTRRTLLRLAPTAAMASAMPSLVTRSAHAAAPAPSFAVNIPEVLASIDKAFAFQNFMMDAYASGSTVRLTQSYSDEALGATAFTYDNAVTIHAYLASGDSSLLDRATVLGDGLLYAQAHNFPFNDGRFGQAYFVNTPTSDGAYITPAAYPYYFYTSAVGDQAWAGMALAQLYKATGQSRFLTGALLVAEWIVSNTYASGTGTAGGYTFGTSINMYNASVPSTNGKSTEHNIDTFAFFTMLSELTGDAHATSLNEPWSKLAKHAFEFVLSMYNPDGPFFWTGTLGDQVSINYYPVPEDCQTWSYMAFLKNPYRKTIDWALSNLETTDTSSSTNSSLKGSETIHGLVFDTASLAPFLPGTDPNAVWLEGTSHTIAALLARVLHGSENLAHILSDLENVATLLSQCIKAQNDLSGGKTAGGKPIPAGDGLLASTSVMDTGFYYTYGPSLHIGATGWYLLAAQATNPFQLGYRIIG